MLSCKLAGLKYSRFVILEVSICNKVKMNIQEAEAALDDNDNERDTTPANPPPSAVVDKAHDEFSNFSLFNDLNSVLGEQDHDDGGCVPLACPAPAPPNEVDGDSSGDSLTRLPSVASIFDYEILQGLLKPGVVKTETEAFVPVGGLVAPEQKRKEFHDYLHKKGFLSGIAKVLISLYDEAELPPKETANEYIAKCLGYHLTAKTEIEENKSYAQILLQRIQRLQAENDWMRRHLDNYEATETPLDIVDPGNVPPIEYLTQEEYRHHHIMHQAGGSSL